MVLTNNLVGEGELTEMGSLSWIVVLSKSGVGVSPLLLDDIVEGGESWIPTRKPSGGGVAVTFDGLGDDASHFS